MFGLLRVKNHDFTPKNHIFPILGRAPPPGSAPATKGQLKMNNPEKLAA
jgi:hypothetical protein